MKTTDIKLVHTDTLSCEPIVRRMSDGSLIMVSQCGDTYEPAPNNRVYFFHSYDDGESWSTSTLLYPEDGSAVYCTEVALYGGRVKAYLTLHNGQFFDWRSMVMCSDDCGHTWTCEGAFAGLESYAFIRGKLELKNGDILLPFQRYPVSEYENLRLLAEFGGVRRPDGRVLAVCDVPDINIDHVDNGVMLSRDGGKSFEKFSCPRFPIRGETGLKWIWSEPTLAELSDGRIAMLIRVKNETLWRSESCDGGKTWSAFKPADIPNPSCKPKLIGLPDGRTALIHSANSQKRNPLCLWVSDDDMKSWKTREVISDFPLNFDYPDGFYENGKLYISIELQRRDVLFIKYSL